MTMGTSRVCVFVLLYLGTSLAFAQTESSTLTLDQAKKIAVDRSLSLEVQTSRLDASRAREGRARSGYYPTLETKIGSEQAVSGISKYASTFVYLVARWNIYNGGIDRAERKIAEYETKQRELEVQLEKLSIEGEVERVFFNLIYLRDVSKIKKRFIEINSEQQSLARQVVSRGGGSQSDVMQFDLRAATLRSELAQIEQDYLSCMIQLKALLGEDVIQSVTPSGDLIHQHIQGTVTDYVNADLTSSPMIRAATNDFDAASTRASAARGRWLPRLDIEGSFGELPQPQGEEKNKFGSTFALVATWEIFGGFDTIYQVQELNAVRSGTNAQLKADIRSLLTSIQIGFGEVETLQRRADFEKNNILTAKKHYELVFADFKRGYKNSSDFSDAAQAWYDAEVGRKKLDLEFIERKIDLEQKLGRQVSTIPMKDVVAGPEGKL